MLPALGDAYNPTPLRNTYISSPRLLPIPQLRKVYFALLKLWIVRLSGTLISLPQDCYILLQSRTSIFLSKNIKYSPSPGPWHLTPKSTHFSTSLESLFFTTKTQNAPPVSGAYFSLPRLQPLPLASNIYFLSNNTPYCTLHQHLLLFPCLQHLYLSPKTMTSSPNREWLFFSLTTPNAPPVRDSYFSPPRLRPLPPVCNIYVCLLK